jgi:hypothetical protein
MCISISIRDLDQDPAHTSLQVRVALTKEVKQQIMEEWRELCQQQGSRNIPRLLLSTWQDLN